MPARLSAARHAFVLTCRNGFFRYANTCVGCFFNCSRKMVTAVALSGTAIAFRAFA